MIVSVYALSAVEVCTCKDDAMPVMVAPCMCLYFAFRYVVSLHVLVLPNQILQVSWKPAGDVRPTAINSYYIINTTTAGMEFINSTSVDHPITMTTITGLPQYSVGTVSVWANISGALSKPAVLGFRMVNIVTNGRYMYKVLM